MWYIWGILILSVWVAVIHYLFDDSLLLYIIGFVAVPFIPGIGMWLWLYPFFVGAYLIAKNMERVRQMLNGFNKLFAIIPLFLMHLLLVTFWRKEFYIYETGLTIYGQDNLTVWLEALIFRGMTGFLGTAMIFVIAKGLVLHIERRRLQQMIQHVSRYSLGIYVFSNYIINPILQHIPFSGCHCLLILIESLVVLTLSVFSIWVFDKIPILRRVFLGGR